MKAMIMAAGLGTRLRSLTHNCPKALVSVAGKPMLEHLILRLKQAGCDEIVINVHHFADQIKEFLKVHDNFGIQIDISDETDQLLDTGGGLEKAFPSLIDMGGTCYLVHNVDILSNCRYETLVQHHIQSNAQATLLVSRRKTSRYLLFDNQNQLVGWINKDNGATKPAGFSYEEGKFQEYAYSGIQVVSPSLHKQMPKGKYSIIDYYLSICHQTPIQGFADNNLRLMDIGKPETIVQAEAFLNTL